LEPPKEKKGIDTVVNQETPHPQNWQGHEKGKCYH